VDHNYLHDWGQVGDPNAHAAISIGESQRSDDLRVGAVVEANLLERIDGVHCAIEAKSSGNAIRGNTVLDSRAGIVVRHGSGNTVEANWVERAGGIWVRGTGTRVVGNVIRDSHGAGLRVLAGDEAADMPGKGYPAASGTVLIGNDVDRLLVGYGYAGSTVPATGTRIEGPQGAAPVLTGLAEGTVRLPAPDGPVPAATRLGEAEVGPASPGSGGVASAGPPPPGVTRGYPLQAAVERRRSDLEALDSALRAGDLAAARQAFGAVRGDRRAVRELRGIAGGAPSPYRADLQALGQALEAGDLEAARAAFAGLGRDWPVLRRLQAAQARDIAPGAGGGLPAGTGGPQAAPLDLVA
jgi:parallel beta-helix repeat protein